MSRGVYLPLPSTLSPVSRTNDRSPEVKFDRLPHATAGFTTSALDGYGLRCHLPSRPAPYASDPVFVYRRVRMLHASFRPHLTMTPLRFAMTSPPSGCQKDFHLRAVDHARHTALGQARAPTAQLEKRKGGCHLSRPDLGEELHVAGSRGARLPRYSPPAPRPAGSTRLRPIRRRHS